MLFRSDLNTIKANAKIVENIILQIEVAGIKQNISRYGNTIWSGVPKNYIATLLRQFNIHPLNLHFQGESISSFLDETDEPKLDLWDVVIPNGHKKQAIEVYAGIKYIPQIRKVETRGKSILVSGSRARVGSKLQEREGMREEKVVQAEEAFAKVKPGKSMPGKAYRPFRDRPLLLIHIIKAKIDETFFDTQGAPLIALGLSFPEFNEQKSRRVKYTVNLVEWKNYFETEIGDDTEEEEIGRAHV